MLAIRIREFRFPGDSVHICTVQQVPSPAFLTTCAPPATFRLTLHFFTISPFFFCAVRDSFRSRQLSEFHRDYRVLHYDAPKLDRPRISKPMQFLKNYLCVPARTRPLASSRLFVVFDTSPIFVIGANLLFWCTPVQKKLRHHLSEACFDASGRWCRSFGTAQQNLCRKETETKEELLVIRIRHILAS